MSSLYRKYIEERIANAHVIETEFGFATYQYLNDQKTVYIMEIYVESDDRKKGFAKYLCDTVIAEAKGHGCTQLVGSVVPSTVNSTLNMKRLLDFGMELLSASGDLIYFKKEI